MPAPLRFDLLACGTCGYDLQGLPLDGRCPECGKAYDKDHGINIRAVTADAETRRGTARRQGLWVTLIAAAVFVLILVILGGMLLNVRRTTPAPTPPPASPTPPSAPSPP